MVINTNFCVLGYNLLIKMTRANVQKTRMFIIVTIECNFNLNISLKSARSRVLKEISSARESDRFP